MNPTVPNQFVLNPSVNPIPAATVKDEEAGLATISISMRIPEFWTEFPRLWFAQFESTISPQKQGEESKFQLVVSKLGREALQQVADIVYNPPGSGKYTAIKTRLLQVFEESPERQFQKLVSELELGSQKPSQLLRKMRELARNCQASEETVQNLWISRLPPSVRAVLAASQDQKLDNLSPIADKVMESMQQGSLSGEMASVSTAQISVNNELCTHMNKLFLEVAALREEVQRRPQNSYRGRSKYRGRSGSRTNSATRTPSSPDWLCYFHYRFGTRARKCEDPCNFNRKSGSGN